MGPLLERLRMRSVHRAKIWSIRAVEGFHINSAQLGLRIEEAFPLSGVIIEADNYIFRVVDNRGTLTRQDLSMLALESGGNALGTFATIEGPIVLGGANSSFQSTIDAIAANLEAILNVESLEASQMLQSYPEVRNSVLNFGIHLGFGRSTSGVTDYELVAAVRSAIEFFEPRLDVATLGVSVERVESAEDGSILRLLLEGTLKGDHAGERVRMLTQIDRALGHVHARPH